MKLRQILGGLLVAGLLSATSVSAQTVLRFATSQVNPNEPVIKVMKQFAERVEERSDGKLKFALYTGDQLGAQKKVNEMIKGG
ncbi:MAG TPA: hypothetical protein VK026_05100, partial [Paenalcaligenes sp.]|nr:hypothetical protein [Paenalcaligenes sp.]